MHSSDPEKCNGDLNKAFLKEVDTILSAGAGHTADFTRFVFPDIDFQLKQFEAVCNFYHAFFDGEALFSDCIFRYNVCFERACFAKKADFRTARFREADFFDAEFQDSACFAEATFGQSCYFSNARFKQTADFHSVRFMGKARFRVTQFERHALTPSPIFTLTSFSQPNTLFYKVNLERALFINCDITQVNFSSVTWLRRQHSNKRMLFEEHLPLDNEYAAPLKTKTGDRDYSLIREIYQKLKKNYDERRDYWTAGDFHYGEMEMQRLFVNPEGKWFRFRKQWHPHLSMLAWYRYTCEYGESYGKPVCWMLGTLLFFTLLFPLTGISVSAPTASNPLTVMSYHSVWPAQSPIHDKVWAEAKLLGRSAITALDTATFQRTPEYSPTYPWGRLAAVSETLLISSLFALFLLALRRQFRR
jgi:hypothetical protein